MNVRSIFLVAATFAAGCGIEGKSGAPMPTGTEARQALEKALDTWKAGKSPASIADQAPKIDVVDYQWKAGDVLESYSIVAEKQGEGNKTFGVKLTLKKPPGSKDVEYMILGKDPVRIYRDEDFTRMLNMDNNPGAGSKSRRR
jgi:hypothetical protein